MQCEMTHLLFAQLVLCLLLYCSGFVTSERSNPRKGEKPSNENTTKIRIGAIFPDPEFSRKLYQFKTFNVELQKLNKMRSSFAQRYQLKEVTTFVPSKMFPTDVIKALCEHMIKEHVAVIIYISHWELYGQSTASAQYLLHMASFTGIPVLAWNADNAGILANKDLNDYNLLQFAPSLEQQVAAMLQLLKRYNWRKVVAVTSHIAGYKYFVHLLREQQMKAEDSFELELLMHVALDVGKKRVNASSITKRLRELNSVETRIILLHATHAEAKTILEAGHEVGLTTDKHLWIATQAVGRIKETEMQAGMLAVHFETRAHPYREHENCIQPQIRNAVRIVAAALEAMHRSVDKFNYTSTSNCDSDDDFTWENGRKLYNYLKRVTIRSAEAGPEEEKDKFTLSFGPDGKLHESHLSIVNLRKDLSGVALTWANVGRYSKNRLEITDITWPGGKATPPQGTPEKFHLKVVTLDEPPFIIVSELDPSTGVCPGNMGAKCDWGTNQMETAEGERRNETIWKCCTGYCVDLLNNLARDIGFTYDLYKVRDGKWGLKGKGKHGWNGLIRDLVTDEAHMCVTSLKINSQRARDIDFSVPFLETGIAIIVKIRRGALSPTAFLEPFEYRTWVFILFISIQGAAISIFAFEWVSPDSFNMQPRPPPGHKFSLFRSYWLVWATLFSASVNTDVPRSYTARFMALVWAAFALTFLAVYTANLAAFMITRSSHYDLSGIRDDRLLNPDDHSPKFSYGTVEGGNTHEILKKNYDELHKYIMAGDSADGIDNYFVHNISHGVQKIKDESLHAFIYDAVVLDYQAGKDGQCEIMTVGKWFSKSGYAFGFPKSSKHVGKVDQFMLRYQQNGDLERLQNFWLTGACSAAQGNRKTHSVPLGIENFISAFVLLATGTITCLVLLGMEYIYSKCLYHKLAKIDRRGWVGVISMSMARSLTFTDAVEQVMEHSVSKQKTDLKLKPTAHNDKGRQTKNDPTKELLDMKNRIDKLKNAATGQK